MKNHSGELEPRAVEPRLIENILTIKRHNELTIELLYAIRTKLNALHYNSQGTTNESIEKTEKTPSCALEDLEKEIRVMYKNNDTLRAILDQLSEVI
jgi:hypothetical protein